MKNGKLVILMIGMAVSGITFVNAQSKRERIEMLTRKTDSLERVLSIKNENFVRLQIKLARLEGAADAYTGWIKQIEARADSLQAVLTAKTVTIESQTSKITQLTAVINGLQTAQKDWESKNEALTTEMNSMKQKPGDTGIAVKETKQVDPPKEEAKTGTVVTGNKPDQPVKN
ncbi:MAG TPA: hypothetical protein VIM16_16950 [Mucilaginibacter sp.]|jgi:chromosome segregation ATPase